MARQNDGCLPPFPIWDDVRTFDGRPWRGRVDVVSGGFPCQDISAAGKGAGIGGARSGLWSEMARIVGEVQPRYVWVENSPLLVRRGLGLVLADLAALGFSARWGVVGAHHAGAPHKRDRIWVLGYANGQPTASGVNTGGPERGEAAAPTRPMVVGNASGCRPCAWEQDVADAEGKRSRSGLCGNEAGQVHQLADCGGDVPAASCVRSSSTSQICKLAGRGFGVARDTNGRTTREDPATSWWRSEPDVGRVAHGLAARVDRLRCIGNGQVPRVVQRAWEELQ